LKLTTYTYQFRAALSNIKAVNAQATIEDPSGSPIILLTPKDLFAANVFAGVVSNSGLALIPVSQRIYLKDISPVLNSLGKAGIVGGFLDQNSEISLPVNSSSRLMPVLLEEFRIQIEYFLEDSGIVTFQQYRVDITLMFSDTPQ